MSEPKEKLIGFYFVVLALFFGFGIGWMGGKDRGRAEQAKRYIYIPETFSI